MSDEGEYRAHLTEERRSRWGPHTIASMAIWDRGIKDGKELVTTIEILDGWRTVGAVRPRQPTPSRWRSGGSSRLSRNCLN
jgi:hypothetical protein